MEADPLGFPDGPNRYAYVGSSPLMYVDPEGRNAILVAALVGAAVGGLIDLGIQLIMNGGDFSCVNYWQVGASAGLGAFGGPVAGLGGRATGIGLSGRASGLSSGPLAAGSNAARGGPKRLSGPKTQSNDALQTPEKIAIDSRGNAIPLKKGEYLTGSKDGKWTQVRDANGNQTGMRIDGGHSSRTHSDPRAQQPHAHVPGVSNSDGTPWLPVR